MNWLVPLLLVGLSTAAVIDLWRLPRPLVPGPPALVWTALFVALPGLAALVWFLVSYALKQDQVEAVERVVGPDDDPEFLSQIERNRGESSESS